MPYSYTTFDHWIGELIDKLRPGSVLDIGPGAGKYGKLARDVAAARGFNKPRTHAIEIDQLYIERFDLTKIYDVVENMDAMTLLSAPRPL